MYLFGGIINNMKSLRYLLFIFCLLLPINAYAVSAGGGTSNSNTTTPINSLPPQNGPYNGQGYSFTNLGGVTSNGGVTQVGSMLIGAIGTPSAPTVHPNTTGTTTYTYYCAALDVNGLSNLSGGLGNSLPSAAGQTTTGASTPNNTVTCGGQKGALGYIVLKGNTSTELGVCQTGNSGNSCSVTDTGQATSSYAPALADETAAMFGNVATMENVGNDSPIDCDFAHYNYCISTAALSASTNFTPKSNPPAGTKVHFTYRGSGNTNNIAWPSNVLMSGANGALAAFQTNGQTTFDQDFFYDGTNYIAGNAAEIFTSFLNAYSTNLSTDITAALQFKPSAVTISGPTTLAFSNNTLIQATLAASTTLTIGSLYNTIGILDLTENSTGGFTPTFAAASGNTLVWSTGTAPTPVTTAGTHNLYYFVQGTGTNVIVGGLFH